MRTRLTSNSGRRPGSNLRARGRVAPRFVRTGTRPLAVTRVDGSRVHGLGHGSRGRSSTRACSRFHEGVRRRSRRARLRVAVRAVRRHAPAWSGSTLGDEQIELTEYQAPRGRPIPPDVRGRTIARSSTSRSSCSDMARAYERLRAQGVEHASTGAAAPARLEPECGRYRGVLLPRPRRPLSRDPALPGRQGAVEVACRRHRPVPRDRPHGDRRRRH